MYKKFGKRLVDVILSIMALIVFLPVMSLTAILIKIEDGGPVFYKQKRVGRNGTLFTLIKFRSMRVNAESLPSALARDMPVTNIGKIIRRFNIDEIPQLFLVLKKVMSIVGPRPPLPSQTYLIELRRSSGALSCFPGLTGLAQVNSYDGMPEDEKAYWDEFYCKNMSFFMDMKIICLTILYFLKPPPVY